MKKILLIVALAATGAAMACDETSSKSEVAGKQTKESVGALVRRAEQAFDKCTVRQQIALTGKHSQMLEDSFNGSMSAPQVKEYAENMEAYCG